VCEGITNFYFIIPVPKFIIHKPERMQFIILRTMLGTKSRDGSIGIAMGYELDARGSNPSRRTEPPIQSTPGGGAHSPDGKQLEREAYHPHLSSGKVMNIQPTSPLCCESS
jgi:hypothetical protein